MADLPLLSPEAFWKLAMPQEEMEAALDKARAEREQVCSIRNCPCEAVKWGSGLFGMKGDGFCVSHLSRLPR